MSVEYAAKIVLGLPFGDLPEDKQEIDVEEHGMEYVSPYYDAPTKRSLVGFVIEESHPYSWAEMKETYNLFKIHELAQKFTEVFGVSPKLFLSTYGS